MQCRANESVGERLSNLGVPTGKYSVTGGSEVSVDIPFRITSNTNTEEIKMKRMKKDYRIVYACPMQIIITSTTPF